MSLDFGELWFTLRLLITTSKDPELHTCVLMTELRLLL